MRIGFIIWAPMLIIFLTVMFLGQTVYEKDFEEGNIRNVYNYSESTFKWNNSRLPIIDYTNETKLDTIYSNRINNFISYSVNYFGNVFMEVSKFCFEFGYTHAEYNFKFYFDFLVKAIKIIIWLFLAVLFTKLLLPMFAIVYITIISVKSGIEKIQKKMEIKKNETI